MRHVLALSVIVPQITDINGSFEFFDPDVQLHQRLIFNQHKELYFFGPSYGVRLNKNFYIGASLFGVYNDFSSSSEYSMAIYETQNGLEQDTFGFLVYNDEGMILGVTGAFSMLIAFDNIRLGLQVRSPIFQIYSDLWAEEAVAAATPVEEDTMATIFEQNSQSETEWEFSQISPTTVSAGIAYTQKERFRISFDAKWYSSFESESLDLNLKDKVDFALGAEFYLTKYLPLAFGIFTDFNQNDTMVNFGDKQMNFIGGTAALTLITPYKASPIKKDDDDAKNEIEEISFATTVGIHYAYGRGEIIGLIIDLGNEDRFRRLSCTAHDIHLFIGSTVIF